MPRSKRLVKLEENQLLSQEDFEELSTHALNSAIWYCSNYSYSTQEIRQKLYNKGYPRGEVRVRERSGIRTYDIVETVVEKLNASYYLDDENFAERFAEGRKRAGEGQRNVLNKLRHRGINDEMAETAIAKVYVESQDELQTYLEKIYAQEMRRSRPVWEMRRRIIMKAVGRGWELDQVVSLVDTLVQEY